MSCAFPPVLKLGIGNKSEFGWAPIIRIGLHSKMRVNVKLWLSLVSIAASFGHLAIQVQEDSNVNARYL